MGKKIKKQTEERRRTLCIVPTSGTHSYTGKEEPDEQGVCIGERRERNYGQWDVLKKHGVWGAENESGEATSKEKGGGEGGAQTEI